jgi:glycosyltransferase involved in cell wall biosynthesis
MSATQRPKVLMIAYACNPEGTGEHWLGWGWAEQAAANYQVHLLTTPNARDAVERHAQRLGIRPRFVSLPRPVRALTEPFGPFGSWTRKMLWAIRATRAAETWHRQERFALVHQTTFHTFRVPFLAATRLNIPSVWGPIAGGEYIPLGFYKYLGALYAPESMRRVFNGLWFAMPPIQRALECADVIFVSNHVTQRFLGPRFAGKSRIVPPNAIRPEDATAPGLARRRATSESFRLLYVGNCLPTRAMPLVFDALARTGFDDYELTIIGDGLGLKLWRREARRHRVAERVKFLGPLPHAQLATHYEQADVFVFPGLRDSGGSALLEAMSKGLPVVCLDWAGPSEIVDEHSGVKVPVTTPEETVLAFARALVRLRNEPEWRVALGQRAAERARALFTWQAKRALLEETYARLLTSPPKAPPVEREGRPPPHETTLPDG